jgi:hypothetical protein
VCWPSELRPMSHEVRSQSLFKSRVAYERPIPAAMQCLYYGSRFFTSPYLAEMSTMLSPRTTIRFPCATLDIGMLRNTPTENSFVMPMAPV